MSKLKSIQVQVQEAVEKAIKSVEEQHVALANKQFDLARKLEDEVRAYSVESLRARHDKAVDSMYDSLLTFNRKVNGLVADLIARVEKEGAAAGQEAADIEAKVEKKVRKAVRKTEGKVEEAIS